MTKEFYDYDFGISNLSRDELDAIAREKAGVVGEIGYGYRLAGELPERVYDYSPRWIATKGMGNHGTLILTPRSRRAAEQLRIGRVEALKRVHGIGHDLAVRIERARRGVKYGHEDRVIACLIENLGSPAWESFPGVGRRVWRWADRWAIDPCGCSAPRLEAVAEIHRRLNK